MRDRSGWFTRERLATLALLAATAIALWVSYVIVRPFLPALAWAVALAVVADPMYCRLAGRMRPSLAAGLAVAVVALVIVGPTVFVMERLIRQVAALSVTIRGGPASIEWIDAIRANRYLSPLIGFIEAQISLDVLLGRAAEVLATVGTTLVLQSLWTGLQIIIALFVLFYLFRDRPLVMERIRSLLPLSRREADEIMRRVSATVYAAIYGQVAVSIVQGALGGLIFAILGLPAPVLWGVVMFVLAVIPVLGAFVVWAPVAIYLAGTGQMGKAIILTAFGTFVIGLIDNLLYPILVGEQLRLHTLPVFFAVVGGIFVFGPSGIVLGPVVLAITLVLLDFWNRRTARGRTAERGLGGREGS